MQISPWTVWGDTVVRDSHWASGASLVCVDQVLVGMMNFFQHFICLKTLWISDFFFKWTVYSLDGYNIESEILSEWAMPGKQVLTLNCVLLCQLHPNHWLYLPYIPNYLWKLANSLPFYSSLRNYINSQITHCTPHSYHMYLDHRMALKSEWVVTRVHRDQTGGKDRGSLVTQTQCRWLEELLRKLGEICMAALGLRLSELWRWGGGHQDPAGEMYTHIIMEQQINCQTVIQAVWMGLKP